jgi:hypothetical protein
MAKLRLATLSICLAASVALLAGCLEEELRDLSDDLEALELEERLNAVERLKQIEDDRAVELLVEALEGDEELIDAAGNALAYMGRRMKTDEEPDKVNEMVEQTLKDTHLEEMVRAKAAWTLGEIGDRESIATLKGFTLDAQVQVKANDVEALKKLGYYSDGAAFAMNDDGTIKKGAFDGTPKPPEEEA